MVFGEPDVEIKKQKDGKIMIEIKGVDVYDPTTGQIRSASTDDIACWFIDSNYNGNPYSSPWLMQRMPVSGHGKSPKNHRSRTRVARKSQTHGPTFPFNFGRCASRRFTFLCYSQ